MYLFLKNFPKKVFWLINHQLVFYDKQNASKGQKKMGFLFFPNFNAPNLNTKI